MSIWRYSTRELEHGVNLTEPWIVPIIDRQYCCAASFHLEREPAIPSADIQNSTAMQIFRYGKLVDSLL